jgi:hypothetical protein
MEYAPRLRPAARKAQGVIEVTLSSSTYRGRHNWIGRKHRAAAVPNLDCPLAPPSPQER